MACIRLTTIADDIRHSDAFVDLSYKTALHKLDHSEREDEEVEGQAGSCFTESEIMFRENSRKFISHAVGVDHTDLEDKLLRELALAENKLVKRLHNLNKGYMKEVRNEKYPFQLLLKYRRKVRNAVDTFHNNNAVDIVNSRAGAGLSNHQKFKLTKVIHDLMMWQSRQMLRGCTKEFQGQLQHLIEDKHRNPQNETSSRAFLKQLDSFLRGAEKVKLRLAHLLSTPPSIHQKHEVAAVLFFELEGLDQILRIQDRQQKLVVQIKGYSKRRFTEQVQLVKDNRAAKIDRTVLIKIVI
jgi:hypothetical protein